MFDAGWLGGQDSREKWALDGGVTSTACGNRVGISPSSAKLWRRNHSLRLIGVSAFFVARIDRRGHIIIGCAVDYGGVRIKRAWVQDRIDFRVWSAGLGAAINVVADDALRLARGPGQIDRVLRGRGAGAGQRFDCRRV